MKKIIIVVLSILILTGLFIVGGCKKNEEIPVDTSLRIMSFNIRTLSSEIDSNNNWETGNRKIRVIQVIEDYSPDIVGMQEVTVAQYNELVPSLTAYSSYGVERTGTGFNEMSAIFYKTERFEKLDEYSFWFSETPDVASIGWDAATFRICSALVLRDKISNEQITFLNAHLDHIGTVAREQSALMLKDRTSGIDNAIVTGDFNFHEGSDNYDTVISGDLTDSKFLAPEGERDLGATYQGFSAPDPEGTPIDFMLMHTGSFTVDCYKIVTVTYDGFYPSDHCPIYADIDYAD